VTLKVSVLSSAFNRGDLLDRALATYAKQTFDSRYWEYVLVDDGSTDSTRQVADKWASAGLPIRVLDAAEDLGCRKEPGKWRDGSKPRNAGSTQCHGEVLICTHPEIMVPPDALEVAYESVQHHPAAWHTAIPYWLPPGDMDAVSWHTDLPALRALPGFYANNWPDPVEGLDYRNQNQERRRTWESEVWFAIDMAIWRGIGGFREFDVWGPVDIDFMNRRKAIGIPTGILTSPQSEAPSGSLMVYHQWHDAPRNLELAMETLRQQHADYPDADAALIVGGLRDLYRGGHKRGDDRRTSADLYRFAANFCAGQSVLDTPCGTGYGADCLDDSYRYVGLDIDSEYIRSAKQNFGRTGVEFYQGNMLDMPFPSGTFDRVLSFGSNELVGNREGLVSQIRRVVKPGGIFIVSTPRQVTAPGTPRDRQMLSPQQLVQLFTNAGFVNLDSFHQPSFEGTPGTNPVRRGLPAEDQLMILVGARPE
jgi:SAM-dependent methyltransferase